jgi:hypothetical protein
MDVACDTHGNERNKYHASRGNPEGKRPLGTPVGSWRYNIKMVVTEVEWRGVCLR